MEAHAVHILVFILFPARTLALSPHWRYSTEFLLQQEKH